MPTNVRGLPGIYTGNSVTPRNIFVANSVRDHNEVPALYTISGASSRDPGSSSVSLLRAGLLLGKITATKKFAPSIIGLTGAAYTGSTQINCLTTAQATELARRQGASGTFKLTGPPAAGGVVRTATVTYSAIGTGSAANEVQTATPDLAATGGTYTISLTKADGVRVTTAAIAYGATLAAAQAALDLAMGAASSLVVLSSAGSAAPWSTGPIALVFTFSGAGYLALEQPMVSIDITSMTGTTTMTIVETTKGVPAANTVVVTAAGVNEVQRVTFAIASTGGNVAIEYTDPTTGGRRETGPAAWSATDATYLSAINAALDLSTGVSGGIVATAASATDTDLGFVLTFSGTGFAGKPHDLVTVTTLPTSSTSSTVTRTTAGVAGAFAAGSLIQPTDGSETPVTVLTNEMGVDVVSSLDNTSIDQPLCPYLVGGDLISANIVNLTEGDASVQAWLKAQLRAIGRYTFNNDRT